MKIYVDAAHYVKENRKQLHSIPKAQWNDRTPEERTQIYGEVANLFDLTDSIEDSDICLLTMKWNYYVQQSKIDLAFDFAVRAQQADKKIIVWSEGDYGVNVPIENSIVFQFTIRRSKRHKNEYAIPPMMGDNVSNFGSDGVGYRQKGKKPIVGFCGQAVDNPIKLAGMSLKNMSHAVRYLAKKTYYLPPPVVPPAYLRSRVLKTFEDSRLVTSNFIIRSRYGAGMKGSERTQSKARKEYIDNLDQSDYIIAVRGTGNWSLRFYEALNWGRIPIFIDTDCVLPYDFALDWKRYCVWIDKNEIAHAPEKVADFHASLSNDDFIALQRECRKVWEDYLSRDGLYRHFHEHFEDRSLVSSSNTPD